MLGNCVARCCICFCVNFLRWSQLFALNSSMRANLPQDLAWLAWTPCSSPRFKRILACACFEMPQFKVSCRTDVSCMSCGVGKCACVKSYAFAGLHSQVQGFLHLPETKPVWCRRVWRGGAVALKLSLQPYNRQQRQRCLLVDSGHHYSLVMDRCHLQLLLGGLSSLQTAVWGRQTLLC